MEKQMTRRDFVGASALAGAGLAALGVGSPVVARADESFDKEVDFAVVGTGTAVFAAFAAKDAGASSVALIEKAPRSVEPRRTREAPSGCPATP